ncbi:MAG: hypothetical protein AAGF94_02685 [Pseudomonadota bacterium]
MEIADENQSHYPNRLALPPALNLPAAIDAQSMYSATIFSRTGLPPEGALNSLMDSLNWLEFSADGQRSGGGPGQDLTRGGPVATGDTDKQARLYLLGPLRLLDVQEQDRTPRSPQQQAMLAMLALAPNGTISRTRLQDMLWGEKDPRRAAQSMRTALHGLRKSLIGFSPALIEADAVNIRLQGVSVDLFVIEAQGASAIPSHHHQMLPDLLEGINLRGDVSDEFEEWLRVQRSHWYDRLEEIIEAYEEDPPAPQPQATLPTAVTPAAIPTPLDEAKQNWPVVGLLQPVIHSQSAQTMFFAEALMDRVATGLREYIGARCYDYRDLAGVPDPSATATRDPDLFLRMRVYEQEGELALRILAMRQANQELLWSVDCANVPATGGATEHEKTLAMLGKAFDQAAKTLETRNTVAGDAPISPFHALSAMFQLDHTALGPLRTRLHESWVLTGTSIYPALLAYLNTFSVGEHWRSFDGAVRDETRSLLANAGDTAHSGGIGLALAGHAMGYILHDRESSAELLDRAIRFGPQSAFCWDHLALHHLYNARYKEAHYASAIALKMGEFSPIRFTLETTRCMISALEGDYRTASKIGQRILAQRPNYGAALRYTSISLAYLGKAEEAKDYIARIRSMDPNFSADWVQANRMAVQDETAKKVLEQGLIDAGA